MYKNCICFTSSSTLGTVSLFNFNHSSGCYVTLSHCGFNLHVPGNSDADHIFLWLLTISISSWNVYSRHLPFFSVVCLFIIDYINSLYIIDRSLLSDMCCEYFLPVSGLPFNILNGDFDGQKSWMLMKSKLPIFPFMVSTFFFFAIPRGMLDLSSPNRNWIYAPCSGSMES